MSAPIERSDTVADALIYAPPWARKGSLFPDVKSELAQSPPVAPTHEPPHRDGAPRMPMGVGGPNIEWAPKLAPVTPFAGDVQMRELRRRLALQPDIVPEPPLWTRRESAVPWMARLAMVFAVAAVGAYGLTVISTQYITLDKPAAIKQAIKQDALTVGARPAEADAHETAQGQLIVKGRTAFANEPLPLGLTLTGSSGNEFVVLKNLAEGTSLSAGSPFGPRTWRVAARDIDRVFAQAPRDYVGVMDAAVDLHASNRLLDSRIIRLEWLQRPVARLVAHTPQEDPWAAVGKPDNRISLPPEEVALMLRRGQQLLSIGDISAARLMLLRAANTGDPQAALYLGASYDPVALRELGVIGFAPDAEQARTWYRKAAEFGSTEAAGRVERLARAPRQ